MKMPAWGLIVICLFSFVFIWPNGILWAIANTQAGMGSFSDLLAGVMFPGQPAAVLASYTYGYTVLEQCLNLISDYKFGFYMKIPKLKMFCGQIYGTLLGPFINYGFMQLIVDRERPYLIGQRSSEAWDAVQTRSYYSQSIIWGILGPKRFFNKQYPWVYYSFVVGPGLALLVWLVQKWKRKWNMDQCFNPPLMFLGVILFPKYQSVNFLTSLLACILFMGILPRYAPVWWRKFNYLTGVGLNCGTQLMTLVDFPKFVLLNSSTLTYLTGLYLHRQPSQYILPNVVGKQRRGTGQMLSSCGPDSGCVELIYYSCALARQVYSKLVGWFVYECSSADDFC